MNNITVELKEDGTIIKDGVVYTATKKEYSGAMFNPPVGRGFWKVRQYRTGFRADAGFVERSGTVKNVFKTESHAQQFADALNTLAELRETSVLPVDEVTQWCIYSEGDLECYGNLSPKLTHLSPFYETKEDAEAAIKRVGKQRIINMFRVFKGVYADES